MSTRRVEARSFQLGLYVALFAWSATEVLLGAETRDVVFYANLVLLATFGVMAIWTAKEIHRKRGPARSAHIDTEGVYAAVRCTGCGVHLMYLEHGHDLSRLTSARDGHECAAETPVGGGS